MLTGVGELEDHRALRAQKPADQLPVGLHGRHAHHLRQHDLGVLRHEVVADLVVVGANVHLLPPDPRGEAGVGAVRIEEDGSLSGSLGCRAAPRRAP